MPGTTIECSNSQTRVQQAVPPDGLLGSPKCPAYHNAFALSAFMNMRNLASSAFLGGAFSSGTALINECYEMVRPRF